MREVGVSEWLDILITNINSQRLLLAIYQFSESVVGSSEYDVSMPQVSRQMQDGHAYLSSGLSQHHLLRGYKKIPAKKNCQ